MINNHYQLYVDKILSLAETIVVKFEDAATALNLQVQLHHGMHAVDEEDPQSWKYYQNISGQYHYTDEVIVINSLDTSASIVFTVDNLAIHKATRKAYTYGSRYYRELVLQHPEQELLILGVLYPCDLDTAIAAPDGTILQYPRELVETNEYTFLAKLQKWITQYLDRWVNRQYTISDDLYTATYMGQFYLHLVQAIFCIRLEACKTNEAHSFHVQQYLASNGMLDVYLNSLTLDQALFFYRNILYLQRNAGKRDTFDWLLQMVMTRRNLPVYAYSMSHDVEYMGHETPTQIQGLLPEVVFKRKPLNKPAIAIEKANHTLAQVFGKVEPLALGNARFHAQYGQDMADTLAYSPSATVATKMLESSVVDYVDAVPYPLGSILLNHWLYWVCAERYVATVLLNIPHNGTNISLGAKDAVVLFLYALTRSMGPLEADPLLKIPTLRLSRVTRLVPPSRAELVSMTSPRYVSPQEIDKVYATRVQSSFLESIDSFHSKCLEIYDASGLQHAIYASRENMLGRSQVKAAVARLYSDEGVALTGGFNASGTPYTQWMGSVGLDFSLYTREDFFNLAEVIVSTATGASTHKRYAIADVQREMIKLFTQLCSYSIQMVADVNQAPVIIASTPSLRIGDGDYSEQNDLQSDSCDVRARDYTADENNTTTIEVNTLNLVQVQAFEESFEASSLLPVRFTQASNIHPLMVAQIRTGVGVLNQVTFDTLAEALSREQRLRLVDEYCACGIDGPTEQISISLNGLFYVGGITVLDGFVYNGSHLNAPALYVGDTIALDGFVYNGSHLNAPALYVGDTIALDGFVYNGGQHNAPATQPTVTQPLDALKYSGGVFVREW